MEGSMGEKSQTIPGPSLCLRDLGWNRKPGGRPEAGDGNHHLEQRVVPASDLHPVRSGDRPPRQGWPWPSFIPLEGHSLSHRSGRCSFEAIQARASTQTPVYSSSGLNKGAETVFFSFCFLFGLGSDRGERNAASQGRAGMS